jgi:serine/threonine-protein kinase
MNPLSSEEFSDSVFDGALRAAFGGDPTLGSSILPRLQQTVGVQPRVLLRDTTEEAPMVRPAGADEESAGRYRVIGEIARGGVGVILKGHDGDLGRDVAMKVLRSDHAGNPAVVQRFVEEAQIAGQLQHPGILPVYELGMRDAHCPFFTMKLVKGQTLSTLLHNRSGASEDRLRFVRIFEDVCQAMAYAHARGVIHRDLKPSNVMVGAFGEVQVVDWGLAKVLTAGGIGDDRRAASADHSVVRTARDTGDGSQSLAGSIMGTPAYMPPEQARGDIDRISERTDVFSLGAMMCEIMTGKPPYVGTQEEVLQQAAGGATASICETLTHCGADAELIELTQRCLAAAPEARPRDAAAVAREITDYLAHLEERARVSEIAAAEARTRAVEERRARRLTLALAITVLVTLCSSAAAWVFIDAAQQDRQAAANANVDQAVDRVNVHLGEVQSAAPGVSAPLERLEDAAEQLRQALSAGEPPGHVRLKHAEDVLERVETVAGQRRLVDEIEEAVIAGATHYDGDSWLDMEARLRKAFQDYGINLGTMSNAEIAEIVRASDFAAELTDGLELWIATHGDLIGMGQQRLSVEQMKARMEVLFLADTNPFRSRVRELLWDRDFTSYAFDPEVVTGLMALVDTPEFEHASPRTISWIAMGCALDSSGQPNTTVYERGVVLHPDDFMMNWDFAFTLRYLGRHQEAIRYHHRCVSLRPDVAGAWRGLGGSHRQLKEHAAARTAFERAIELQPGHAPSYVDLGTVMEELDDHTAAIAHYNHALKLNPDLAIGHARLGRVLQEQGECDRATASLKEAVALSKAIPGWTLPVDQWLAECEEDLESTPR